MLSIGTIGIMGEISVSLRSYIHSYLERMRLYNTGEDLEFPSPYGVIFILTSIEYRNSTK